jgi:hypothetical protein
VAYLLYRDELVRADDTGASGFMTIHQRQGRFLWKPLTELSGTDYRLLYLGIPPPPPSDGQWESEIRGRWTDDSMSVLTTEREAELRRRDNPDRVVSKVPGGVFDIAWAPQPGPQTDLIECSCPEVFMGGARGGGKTDGVLAKWAIKSMRYGSAFNAMMFRKTTVASQDAIERSKELFVPIGGVLANEVWKMPGGGRVGFGYLDSLSDADVWQGRNLTDVWIEEVGHYASPDVIWRLFGVLRSAHGVPVQMILTGNPGNAGQHWISDRYELVPFPRDTRILSRALPNGKTHKVAVIPSRIRNNRILMENDPGYIDRLHMVGSAKLVKAWLEGDWSAVEGAFFDCWSAGNIIPPFEVPKDWVRFRSADWGSASPFSIGWWAVVQDDYKLPDGRTLPRGALIRYREWYGSSEPAGAKGLKLTAEQVADGIIRLEKPSTIDKAMKEKDEKHAYGVLDPSTFKEDGGPSVAQRLNDKLIKAKVAPFRKADNTRVAATAGKDRRGPMSGWDQMRARIIGVLNEKGEPTGQPMLYVFSTCVSFIRTVPVLQHDPAKPEDLDTESIDHVADETRYACSSRPWLRTIRAPDTPQDGYRSNEEMMMDMRDLPDMRSNVYW